MKDLKKGTDIFYINSFIDTHLELSKFIIFRMLNSGSFENKYTDCI